jgi:hypothetical protein
VRLRSVLAFIVGTLLAVLLLPVTAFAQTVVIGTPIEHSISREAELEEIRFTECSQDGSITIPFTLTERGDYDLVAWSGTTNCEDDDRRSENNGTSCRDLGGIESELTAQLKVRDVLAASLGTDRTTAGADICTKLTKGTVNVYIMLQNGPTDTVAYDSVSLSFDFQGPSGSDLESVGVGENQLFVRWDASSSSDIDGY